MSYPTADDLAAALASPNTNEGAALVGTQLSGTGTIAATVGAKLDLVRGFQADFGAVGDGTTDNKDQWSAAIDWLTAGGELRIEAGEYVVSEGASLFRTGEALFSAKALPGVKIIGESRASVRFKFTDTNGYFLNVTADVIDASGTNLVHDLKLDGFTVEGAGDGYGTNGTNGAGNTETAIRVQGFQLCELSNLLIEKFGQDGIHIDRLYYQESPDSNLDDRGAHMKLTRVQVRRCGRYGIQLGGEFSADHCHTEHCYVTQCGNDVTHAGAGIYAYVHNWVDTLSLYQGRDKCAVLRAQDNYSNVKPTQCVVWNGTRLENNPYDCNLEIIEGGQFVFNGVTFNANVSTHRPSTAIKVASTAGKNVGYVALNQPKFINYQASDFPIDIGAGSLSFVRMVDPLYAGFTPTTEINNPNNQACVVQAGRSFKRVSGGGAALSVTGADGANAFTVQKTGESQPFVQIDTSGRTLQIGPGGSTAPNVQLSASTMADGVTAALAMNRAIRLPGGLTISTGSGSPEGIVAALVGSIYLRNNGGAGTTFYAKESGAGDTGWVAK